MQSFFAGLAASGALTSGLRLITKAAFDKSPNGLRKGTSMYHIFFLLFKKKRVKSFILIFFSAVLFLAVSTFVEFLCIFLYAYVFSKLPIVKYYRTKAAREGSKTVSSDLAAAGIQTKSNKTVKLTFFLGDDLYFIV